LEFEDGIANAVLLHGPLYHLVESEEHLHSLSEAHRVLRSGGHLFATRISRFASTIDGLQSGYFLATVFQGIM
jgi:predicted SAM-dependent methyltransferase